MWQYNQARTSDELRHYGVLGMKWGVRRGRSKQVYEKAQKKMSKLDDKAVKAEAKKLKRANPLVRTSISDAMYENAARKADKAYSKAMNWYKKVEKTLGSEKASAMVNTKGYNIGKEYAQKRLSKRF